jgi:hypothetical protein
VTARRFLFSLLGLVLLAGAGRLPLGEEPDHGLLRLAWRSMGQRVQLRRAQDPSLPSHMRLPEAQAFETVILPYHLEVEVDGRQVLDKRIQAPGVHHDRPLVVQEDIPLSPGRHQLHLRYRPETGQGPSHELRQAVEITAGRIRLVTLEDQELVVR